MTCKSCPAKRHCFDKGSCEECDFGKAFEGYNKKIKTLREKNKKLQTQNEKLKQRIETLLNPDFLQIKQMKEKQIEEMAWDMCDIPKHPSITSCEKCNLYGKCHSMYYAKRAYNAGYRKQSEGEWEMFELITSTYYGKQYYFLLEDGFVYSSASCSIMCRDEAIDEFLNIFRYRKAVRSDDR